ncbi:hypothetical protein CBG25_03640 [Arsenophonus sp. ENCA]|uniref:hypothetical protein n=1 Tax=Arsenophonus sp. ENCA TaxID=1987579 RepID=UPI000BDB188E|nr:hypothetical protein [Arsenophonus sp. ENCA]PAV08856.1 hypothetical protein CBG25_03640 [Arsenophonus sp. ENCA]
MNKQLKTALYMNAEPVREKLKKLFKILSKNTVGDIPSDINSMISGLFDNLTLENSPATMGTNGTFDVIFTLDFDESFYNQVISAARALKVDVTHSFSL